MILEIVISIAIVVLVIVIYAWILSKIASHKTKNCYLYYGTTSHTRLKGGAVHTFTYPICFSFIDIDDIAHLGWSYWPIFKVNSQYTAFSSLQNENHMKDLPSSSDGNIHSTIYDLPMRVREFIRQKTKGKTAENISIMTHLTYFGYCFNPITLYFVNYNTNKNSKQQSSSIQHSSGNKGEHTDNNTNTTGNNINKYDCSDDELRKMIVVEVSNTPWIEQHSYMLDESVEGVDIIRTYTPTTPTTCTTTNHTNTTTPPTPATPNPHPSPSLTTLTATWLKAFHVSPFMEMDYKYKFSFSTPGEVISVYSQLIKLHPTAPTNTNNNNNNTATSTDTTPTPSTTPAATDATNNNITPTTPNTNNTATNDVWFTASFNIKRIPFTPLNILYILLFYPLHTRIIQVLIHYEAILLYIKGIPTFKHPKNTILHFGFGVTDRHVIRWMTAISEYFRVSVKSKGDDKVK